MVVVGVGMVNGSGRERASSFLAFGGTESNNSAAPDARHVFCLAPGAHEMESRGGISVTYAMHICT